MNCSVKERNDTKNKMLRQLKKDNPTLKNTDIKTIVSEVLNDTIDGDPVLSVETEGYMKEKIHPTTTKKDFIIREPILTLSKLVETNPTAKNKKELLTAETVAGMRDLKGNMIVNPMYPRTSTELRNELGSSDNILDEDMTIEEAEEFYIIEDGTLSTADNVNKAMKELDRKKFGEDFDVEWSRLLDKTLGNIIRMAGDIDKQKLKMQQSTFKQFAQGSYNIDTGEMKIKVDSQEPGNKYRDRFTMTNQEVYVHELTHSVLSFAFDSVLTTAGKKNLKLVELVVDLKQLYRTARDNTTWQDMLIGIDNPSTHEIFQAKKRYNYIFNNKGNNGLHEFSAHLLTNKQFAEAMHQVTTNVTVLDKRTEARKEQDKTRNKEVSQTLPIDFIDKLIQKFTDFIATIKEYFTKKDGSVSIEGAELLYKIIAWNGKKGTEAVENQTKSTSEQTIDFIERNFNKIGDPVNTAIEASDNLIKPYLEDSIDFMKGKPSNTRTKIDKERFDREFKIQRRIIARETGIKITSNTTSEMKKKANETISNTATIATNLKIAKENLKVSTELLEFAEKSKLKITKESDIPQADRTAMEQLGFFIKTPFNMLVNIPYKLYLLYKLNAFSRGVYGVENAKLAAKLAKDVHNDLNKITNGFLSDVVYDFMAKDELYDTISDAILKLKHDVDGYREKEYEQVLSQTKKWFGKVEIQHRDNLHYDRAMSHVLLRTDIQSLGMNSKAVLNLLKNPAKIEQLIQSKSTNLHKFQMLEIEAVAKNMILGNGLVSNSANIVRHFGLASANTITDVDLTQIATIDQLITLKALQLVDVQDKQNMIDFLSAKGYTNYSDRVDKRLSERLHLRRSDKLTTNEYRDQVRNGVDHFISYARGMEEANKKELIDEPFNHIKGYLKETSDTGVSLQSFPMSDKDQKIKEGFEFVRDLGTILSNGKPQGLFRIQNSDVKKVSGALGLQDRAKVGRTLMTMVNEEFKDLSVDDRNLIFKMEKSKLSKKYFNRASNDNIIMYPMYNKFGTVVNFRMTDTIQEKHELLNMEERGTQNLSRSFGTGSPVKATEAHNFPLIDILKKDFDDNYTANKKDYITIDVSDTAKQRDRTEHRTTKQKKKDEYTDLWTRLPTSTQNYAKEIFETDQIIVRKDLLIPLLGYDEFTITNLEMMKNFSPHTLKKIRSAEKNWQDGMGIAKSNIVIKTPAVTQGNLSSNAKILMVMGMNPIEGFKLLKLGFKELQRYEQDLKELRALERDQLSGIPTSQARINELYKNLESNTVAPLLEAGMYQSLVEDVDVQDDSNKVAQWIEEKVDTYIPNETVNTILQHMFLTSKTKPYQVMLKTLQMSDFLFRYAQYTWDLGKGTTQKKAMRKITDNYINYDDPIRSPMVSYLDKMGPAFFIRYAMRIQKVIVEQIRNNPTRALLNNAQQFLLDFDQSDIFDVFILDRGLFQLINPFRIPGHIKEVVNPSGLEILGIT